jgi:hypothetical protein
VLDSVKPAACVDMAAQSRAAAKKVRCMEGLLGKVSRIILPSGPQGQRDASIFVQLPRLSASGLEAGRNRSRKPQTHANEKRNLVHRTKHRHVSAHSLRLSRDKFLRLKKNCGSQTLSPAAKASDQRLNTKLCLFDPSQMCFCSV